MKLTLFFITVLCFLTSLAAQSFEQSAVDFFTAEILPDLSNTKVLYDGVVMPVDKEYEEIAELVVSDYYGCLVRRMQLDSTFTEERDEELKLARQRDSYKIFSCLGDTAVTIPIPKNIVKRRNLKYKKRRVGRFFYYPWKIWRNIFPSAYILRVFPRVKVNQSYIVWLRLLKKDSEYGYWCYIQLDDRSEVIEWCCTGWVV